jgi:hypothetical protein
LRTQTASVSASLRQGITTLIETPVAMVGVGPVGFSIARAVASETLTWSLL